METKVQQTVVDNRLLSSGDRVLVALSGGPDSVALLYLLSRSRDLLGVWVAAVYINHRLRPKAASEEERFCTRLCARLDVPLTIIRANVRDLSKKAGMGVEEGAREFRYATFECLAHEMGCNRIALGHHADDRVETILFRLIRGSGRTGLAGMPVKRGKIIRPLFDVSKTEILAYLKKHRLGYCTDLSNARSEYARNFIRNRLLPLIEKRLNQNVRAAILGMSETIGLEEEYLESQVARAERRIMQSTPGGKIILATRQARDYPVWFRRRMLRRCLKAVCPLGRYPDRAVTDRLDRLWVAGGAAMSLPGGIQAVPCGDKLYIWHRHKLTYAKELPVGHPVSLEWPSLRLKASISRGKAVVPRRHSPVIGLDADKIKGQLTVRNARSGDRFRPLGGTGTKKVADLLADRKVPAPMRDEIPVVCDEDGVIWVVGVEIADRVKRDRLTKKVLRIAVSKWSSTAPQTV